MRQHTKISILFIYLFSYLFKNITKRFLTDWLSVYKLAEPVLSVTVFQNKSNSPMDTLESVPIFSLLTYIGGKDFRIVAL